MQRSQMFEKHLSVRTSRHRAHMNMHRMSTLILRWVPTPWLISRLAIRLRQPASQLVAARAGAGRERGRHCELNGTK